MNLYDEDTLLINDESDDESDINNLDFIKDNSSINANVLLTDYNLSDTTDELDVIDKPEGPSKNSNKKDYSFQTIHPQHNTHQIKMQKEDSTIVPNFIPNNLPRSDRGDREYYCCTMLTLFKPWRTGKDLKDHLESWDKSFTNHVFSNRQLEIM